MVRMQRVLSSILLLSGFLFGSLPRLSAVEFSPVISAHLYGGQYFFDNEESSLSGNARVNFAPAIGFSERWSLIPSLSASWRGTKSVQDLVGGGTVLQQTQDYSGAMKAVYNIDKKWLFKAGGAYRLQLLKETKDEKWGKGLFDFEKPSGNFEVERAFSDKGSLRVGYDYYLIDFRNFSTLESQQKELGRENAGAKTLNTVNNGAYLAGTVPFPFFGGQTGKFEASYFYTMRDYKEQHLVMMTGDLNRDLRYETNQIAMGSASLPFVFSDSFKLLTDVKGYYGQLISNQNNYDAAKTQFNPNFYAYRDYSVGTDFNFILGAQPIVFTSGFNYVRRQYEDRPVQDTAGTYIPDRILTNEYYANFSLTYPLTKNFRLAAIGQFGWSRSNMKYEKTYRYNYVTSTYLMGIQYEY